VTPSDAVALLMGDAGISPAAGNCPAISDMVVVEGAYRLWGDTDCTAGVQVLDSINLLAYLAGLATHIGGADCPEPGTPFS
jgi:hypothetical protein